MAVETRRNQLPFRSAILPTGHSPVIGTFETRPEKLVRIGSSERTEANNGLPLFNSGILERYIRGRQLLRELDEEYGIPNSGFDPVVAQDVDGKEKVFVLTNRIEGANLLDALEREVTPFVHCKTQELIESFTGYIVKKAHSGGFFFSDLRIDQFMLGRMKKESQDRLYLVDLDASFSYFDPGNPLSEGSIDLLSQFIKLSQSIDIAKILDPDLDIRRPGEISLDFLSDFVKQHPFFAPAMNAYNRFSASIERG